MPIIGKMFINNIEELLNMTEKKRMKELNTWSNVKLKRHIIYLEKELDEERCPSKYGTDEL